MKTLIFIALLVLVLMLIGWIKFRNSDGEATITIDKDEVKEDTRAAVDRLKDLGSDDESKDDKKSETQEKSDRMKQPPTDKSDPDRAPDGQPNRDRQPNPL